MTSRCAWTSPGSSYSDLGGVLLLDSRTGHELDPLENDVDLSGAFQFGD
jgi:hypothetical protein